MDRAVFIDHYEVLQISPNADPETIERVFRHLAKRFHPDNPQTGNRDRFEVLVIAHGVLSDPSSRAAYDVLHQAERDHLRAVVEEAEAGVLEEDEVIRERLLSVLYVQRRRDVYEPSLGEIALEQMTDTPREHLEFHLWYLREKQWVERTDRGFALTALGVDAAEEARSRLNHDRLLPATAGEDRDGNRAPRLANGGHDPTAD